MMKQSKTCLKTTKRETAHKTLSTQMTGQKLREHISENMRQSFCAEGVCYSKTEWNRVNQKLYRKK